ncbi:hypothetical protein CJ030_MR5G010389 [Morella rubra]|uniref:Uncharacterized protein n=1 Tax=Morella rubra TaxID=262757 RepID=A0A6A1VNM9_9ROSI|nr:hypothetical protein CJ030_MR5G010389 [Morella rubra]
MSTRAARGAPARGYRRRKTGLDLDLNTAPPSENRDVEGTSTQVVHNEIQTGPRGRSAPPAMIDVEAIDDDVVESSPRAFAQAKNNSRRNGLRTVVDVDLGNEEWIEGFNLYKMYPSGPICTNVLF